MDDSCPSGLTTLLAAINDGDETAKEQVFLKLYDELRQHARRLLNNERTDHSLDPTALVNELYLKLFGPTATLAAESRGELMGKFVHAMRQVLIDHARNRSRAKRGGGRTKEVLDAWHDKLVSQHFNPSGDLEALERLHAMKPRVADVATMRYQGFPVDEIALIMQVSKSTVEADLREARSVLQEQQTKIDISGSNTTTSS